MAPVLNTAVLPPTERTFNGVLKDITISYVQRPDGMVRTYNGWYFDFGTHAKFSGSGAVFAMDCFVRNRCSITSIGTAMQFDPFTGGKTLYVEVESGRNNLSPNLRTLADAEREMQTRGTVMNTKTGKTSTVTEFRADPNSVLQRLSAGELSLSAPTGQKARAWTEEEREDFRKVMEEAAAREAKTASND